MPRHWYVYVITNAVNGKQYVGKATDPRRRFSAHRGRALGGEKAALYHAMRKHGLDSFGLEVIAGFQVESDAFDFERAMIDQLRTNVPGRGYNMTAGGEGASGYVQSAETRSKKSATQRGRSLWTDEQKRAISERLRWHEVTEATRAKLRARVVSDETRAKMSAVRLGRKQSQEHVAKRAAAMIGHKGITMTPEHRAALMHARDVTRAAWSPGANEKRRKAMTGRKMSEEFKQKIRDSWERRRRSNAEGT